MSAIRTICVYCGSGPGADPAFLTAAREFGRILAENRVRLVYGGGSLGLMGALATSVLDHGGEVTGVIPEFLMSKEKRFTRAQEIVVTRDMHERKQIMFERADAFVALPGGIGTLEETIEQMTWKQLGRHKKPILMANIQGFWNPLFELFDHMSKLHFIHSAALFEYHVVERIDEILPKLREALEPITEQAKHGVVATIERM
jgi:uncharacterized protein (TIGR00730 family)